MKAPETMRIELLMLDRERITDWIEDQEGFFGRTIRWLVIGPSVCGCPVMHVLLEQAPSDESFAWNKFVS